MRNDDKITIKERDSARFLPIKDITHITCSGSLSTVHLANGKPVNVCKLLKQFEEELAESGFVRINHYTLLTSSLKPSKADNILIINYIISHQG